MRYRSGIGLLVLALAAVLLGGCKTHQVQEERNALYGQNTELQAELNRTRAALEAAENDRNASAAELERLKARIADLERRLAEKPAYIPGPAVASTGGRSSGNTGGFNNLGNDVEVIQGKGRVTLRIPGDVLFASGSVNLNAGAKTTLGKIAKALNGVHKGDSIIVEGYTDSDPIKKSKWKSNQALSEARAEAVSNYLESQGVAGRRIDTKGYGSAKPQATKAKSRRVEIVVLTAK